MKIIITLIFGFAYLFSSQAFISSEELKDKLGAKNLVILDTTKEEVYKQGHIPGAIRVEASKLRHKVGKHQLINSPKEIEAYFQCLGINNDSEVVIYGHNIDKDLLKASYVALALKTHGLKNISILNGGYPDWVSKFEFDELVSTEKTVCNQGDFKASFNPNVLINKDYVLSKIGKVSMIEARPSEFFYGKKQSSGVKRLGHIPKAKSSYWRDKFDSEYNVKKDKDLNAIYIDDNKLNANKEVIVYCTGGLEASMNWYLLTQHLNFKDVKIYDASMREWGNLDDTPLEI
ncbi:sulfurtransferase [Sulfurimonas sp.]|uniref:sulfurtransferase n=1 Tax=Sulfurimonas sp. TaxID=2022749 RepID=UPI00356968A5